ncbi:ComF family protein [Vagococcus sp. JNUCC 83]
MPCLLCGKSEIYHLSLRELLLGREIEETVCCATCFMNFERLHYLAKKHCYYCLKESSNEICDDCLYWQKKGMSLSRHHALYLYNEAMKDYMSSYKFQGNQSLATVFSNPIKESISRLSYDMVVPMPLSRKRLSDRGFNQIETLLSQAHVTFHPFLKKSNHNKKQSSKTRRERLKTTHQFVVIPENQSLIKEKVILLVDDVYTTGSTMQHAKKTLLERQAKEVITFTLAR